MKRLLLAVALSILPTLAVANTPSVNLYSAAPTVRVVDAAPVPNAAPAAPADQGFVLVTSAGETKVDVGSLAGQVLTWVAAVVGPALALVIGNWLIKLAGKLGVETTDAQRERLQQMVENAISLAAQRGGTQLKAANLTVEVKSQLAADALTYVQEHGKETIQQLGLDPTDPKAVEAIQARIAKALDDKATTNTTVAVKPA